MEFRRAKIDEFDDVMEVIEEGRVKLAALGIDQWQNGNPTREAIEGDIARGDSYVVEDGGHILATAMLSCLGEPTYDVIYDGQWLTESSSCEPTYLVIHRAATSNGASRKGAAKFLFTEAENLARERGLKSIRVDTHAGNIRMRNLMPALGYSECGMILLDRGLEEPTLERIAYEKLL